MSKKTFPTLYKLNSAKTAVQQWTISVAGATINKEYGQYEGKLQQATDTIKAGKNTGKANATTAAEQALKEAEAQWTKKLGDGYVQKLADAKNSKVDSSVITGGILPMLAHKYSESADAIVWPAYVQPKLDGIRCVGILKAGKCTLWTRKRKPILSVPHICATIEEVYKGKDITLDGELYNHDYKDRFQEIVSLVRSGTPKPDHRVVEYHLYDVIDTKTTFSGRLKAIKTDNNNYLKAVHTTVAQTEAEALEQFDSYIAAGYEGCMLRNAGAKYEHFRSYNLQKVKEFDDAEFQIVDVIAGRGKFHDKGIFICKVDDKTFEVTLNGPLDNLITVLKNKQDYIGKMLTVKYQGFTDSGKPRFAKGIAVRDYE